MAEYYQEYNEYYGDYQEPRYSYSGKEFLESIDNNELNELVEQKDGAIF